MRFETRGGAFRYGAGAYTLRDVNFSLESGERLSILGANGAGKTTLIRCAAGLRAWSEGATFLDGADVRSLPPREFRRRVGYVPQARPSAFVYTVMEMVLLGRLPCAGPFAVPSAEDERKAREALELAGISNLERRLCSRISGGEYQLVVLARALASEPELLILDEPESNLDFRNQARLLGTVASLCRERGMSALFSTHYPEHALELSCKSLLVMPDGATLFGASDEIVTEENLRAAFGVPVILRRFEAFGRERTAVAADYEPAEAAKE